ncbi:TonB-dependent receptor [Gemmatimonadetes bacterium T265]|nr:TonB-dependent receptor [Gemmatimonadetes bacterium T265]
MFGAPPTCFSLPPPPMRSLPIHAALLAGLLPAGLVPAVALDAQQSPAATRPDTAAPATPRSGARRDSAQRLTTVTVTATVSGRGLARGAAVVDSARLHAAPPGTSALKVIEQLPGVNVQNADGFGMYEWSNRVTIRGFQSAQIGQTLDGVPLGDMSYGNFNGLGVGRAADPSNLASTTVAQGSGALGTASGNNLGGVVQYATEDPLNRRTLFVQQMGGQYEARRTTLRYDNGLDTFHEGAGAFRGYLSYSRFDTDKWKSGGERYSRFPGQASFLFGQGGLLGHAGQQWQDQLNAKAQLLLGPHKLTAYYDFASRKESDYMDLSLGIFNGSAGAAAPGLGFGPNFDYLGSWAQAKQLAELSNATTYNPLTDASYYWSAQGARQDHLAYVRGEFALGGGLQLTVQPYFHANRGGGDWHAPSYGASYSPDPINFRQTQYHDTRYGATARLTTEPFAVGATTNRFEAGTWLESNSDRIRRPRWRLVDYAAGPDVNFSDPIRLDFDRGGDIGTTLLYAQNTTRLLDDRLGVTYGAKFLRVNADFTNNGNTPTNGLTAPVFADSGRPALSLPTKAGVLPQVGAVFRATAAEELFANYSENVNQFPYSPATGVYNASPATFDYFRTRVDPERARTVEGGVRTRRGPVEAGVTGYVVNYRNRLLGISLCPQTVSCATGFANVGSVHTRGVEGLFNYALPAGLRLYAGASYNASTYAKDYLAKENDPTSRVATGGKNVIDAPRFLGSTSLGYTRDRLVASVTGRYVDKRFFTYTNDLVTFDGRTVPGGGYAPAYGVADFNARYRFGPFRGVRALDVQANALNLFNRRYVSTVGTNGFTTASDYATLLTGAPRQLFVTVGSTF